MSESIVLSPSIARKSACDASSNASGAQAVPWPSMVRIKRPREAGAGWLRISRGNYAASISRAWTFSRVSIQCDPSPWVCKASASRILMNHRFINEASIHSQTKRGPSEEVVLSLWAILICFMMFQA